jgi:type VI secretion system protein ImpG
MARGVGRTDFTMDVSAPVNAIRIIQGPTLPRPSMVLAGQDPDKPQTASGRFAWRLISHLSLNYLSLKDAGTDAGATGLREILKLYADPNDRQVLKQIDGVRSVSYQPVFRRVTLPGPITFARGLEITVSLDETAFAGLGVFVLGAVLEQFFAKYVSINSFTETVIATQQRKEIMRWPIRMGMRQIL